MENIIMGINMICAKLTMPLTILVVMIFVLRIIGKRLDKGHWVNKWNRALRKKHIPLGIALAVISILHALCSSTGLLSLTWGTLAIVLLVAVSMSFYLRKKQGSKWMVWHRGLTAAFLIVLALHFTEIPGFKTDSAHAADTEITSSQQAS